MHLDGCIEVAGAYYAPPLGWLGRAVAVQWDAHHVSLLDLPTGTLLREHRRKDRERHAIHPDDQPPCTPPTTLTLLARAARVGEHVGRLCTAIHRRDGAPGVRRILGVLAKQYGAVVVEDACAAALELGVANYWVVRRYLERHARVPLTLRQVNPLIRGTPDGGQNSFRSLAGGGYMLLRQAAARRSSSRYQAPAEQDRVH